MIDKKTDAADNPILLTAELIHEALEQLSWQGDAIALAERVGRLNIGLPAEDEFSALISWLGRCRLVHKLDQFQSPRDSKDYFQVPDLLAVFSYKGRDVPVLMEVKTRNAQVLSWKPSYYEAIKRYGELLHIPVLVAWKNDSHWTLFDLSNFDRPNLNYKIAFPKAAMENLIGVLAGDWLFKFHKGVGFHAVLRKVEKLGETQDGNLRLEQWMGEVEDAYFTDGNGTRITEISPALWQLFLSTPPEGTEEITERNIIVEASISEETEMQWGYRAFIMLLHTFMPDGESLRWREILRTMESHITAHELFEAAELGLKQSMMRYIFHVQPQTMPMFLR